MRALVGQLTASMGRVDETRDLIAFALPVAASAGVPVVTAIANAALGHLELSLGNDQAALALLDKVADLTDRMNLREPEYFIWQGDYLEALVRVGRVDEVADRVTELNEIAAELHLSAKTVDHYLQSAFRRLGVRNRTELATSVARDLDAPRRGQ